MSDDQAGAEGVFSMDPEHTLWVLARQLVDGPRVIAELGRNVRQATERAPDIPQVRQFAADFETTRASWYNEALPNPMASTRLAIEVFDTFGAGHTHVEDSVEAVSSGSRADVPGRIIG
jgi:hypothetical protein